MRPVRIIIALAFAAAVAVTGCSARAVIDPSAAAKPAPAITAPAATTLPPTTPRATPTTHRQRQAPNQTPNRTPRATPRTSPAPRGLYFTTPQAAMRYLARAYNRNDLVSLGHVTTPMARANLLAMRHTAVNLQLVGCALNAERGDYLCSFTHDFPAAMHQASTGHAHFTAAPADKFGWYMTILNDCG